MRLVGDSPASNWLELSGTALAIIPSGQSKYTWTKTKLAMAKKKRAIIADLTIFPIGEGTSLGDFVKKAFEAMTEVKAVKLYPTAMSTIIETDDIRKVLTTLERAHDAILSMGAKRVHIALRVDHRLDNPHDAEYKVGRMTGRIRRGSSSSRSRA